MLLLIRLRSCLSQDRICLVVKKNKHKNKDAVIRTTIIGIGIVRTIGDDYASFGAFRLRVLLPLPSISSFLSDSFTIFTLSFSSNCSRSLYCTLSLSGRFQLPKEPKCSCTRRLKAFRSSSTSQRRQKRLISLRFTAFLDVSCNFRLHFVTQRGLRACFFRAAILCIRSSCSLRLPQTHLKISKKPSGAASLSRWDLRHYTLENARLRVFSISF